MQLLETPEFDTGWQAQIIAREAGATWLCVPMLFNDRLVCVRDGIDTLTWKYAWCFQKGPALTLSAMAFQPLTQDEPLGWHKRAGVYVRQAPERDKDPQHNRPRCIHGAYTDQERCPVATVCPDFPFPFPGPS